MGIMVQRYGYDSFGNQRPGVHPIKQPFAYTGREYDPETGMYYYRARYYDPKAGRFISRDPIGFAGGDINLYAYVGNNPVNLFDPFGLWDDAIHGKYSAEDHGWTSPFNPLSTWRHFRSIEDVQRELNMAIAEGDCEKFKSLMHQGQDAFSHYNQGYRWWKGGHMFDGNAPDDPDKHRDALAKQKEWTATQEYKWKRAN
jgi:RHS repeat-associated protein